MILENVLMKKAGSWTVFSFGFVLIVHIKKIKQRNIYKLNLVLIRKEGDEAGGENELIMLSGLVSEEWRLKVRGIKSL